MTRKASTRNKHVMPGFERGNAKEVMPVIDDPQLGHDDFPPKVAAAINAFANDAYRFAVRNCKPLQALDRAQRLHVAGMLAYVAHMGFAMAVYRYASELKDVPELAAWHRKRKAGGDRGRKTASERCEERHKRIRDTWASMAAAGEIPTNAKVAHACRVGISTVIRAFKDDTTKRKKR
jgi:hypothetical protein